MHLQVRTFLQSPNEKSELCFLRYKDSKQMAENDNLLWGEDEGVLWGGESKGGHN